ncbi:NUDIX domain-containing protein [Pseudomonas azotifigens]|uniref:NUDIX domain-containing protein n=1 Tax=Stutzerimonas azotifigens TaxID=291995 RepID=A0ABR5Z5G5_9GAMM|nr:NUDIX domain-containing protein [Stutzerimonas azotifigens]
MYYALAGQSYWATPSGGLEEGETFCAAAIRELREETGIEVGTVTGPVANRRVSLTLPCAERVLAKFCNPDCTPSDTWLALRYATSCVLQYRTRSLKSPGPTRTGPHAQLLNPP